MWTGDGIVRAVFRCLVVLGGVWISYFGQVRADGIPNTSESIRRQRNEIAAIALREVGDAARSRDIDKFALNAHVLGELRYVQHAGVLFREFIWTSPTYRPKFVTVLVPTLEYYPAASAILKMGSEASPALVEYIARQHVESEGFQLACMTLVEMHVRMYGNWPRAKKRALRELEQEIVEHRDGERRVENLKRAVKFVAGYVGKSYGRWKELPRFRAPAKLTASNGKGLLNISLALLVPAGTQTSDFVVELMNDQDAQYELGTRSLLPAGVQLSADGWIRGRTMESGDYEFVVKVRSVDDREIVCLQRFVLELSARSN